MRAAVTLHIALALSGCAQPAADVMRTPPELRPQLSAEDVEDGALSETNRVRTQAGLPALQRSAVLDDAARGHARELAGRRVLDHASTDSTRATLALRLRLAGVTAWTRIGENLASLLNPHIHPGRASVRLWLDSPPHRANLLEPRFQHAGTGVARAANGTWYIVQVYGEGIRTEATR